MHKKIIQKPSLKVILIFFALFILVLSFVYALRVQFIPRPEENLLSDFAVYLNNWLMPFLTLGTVIALIITLKLQGEQLAEQQKQFSLQRNSQIFESYVNRFEIQYQYFLELSKREVPLPTPKNPKLVFNLHEYMQLSNTTQRFKVAKALIQTVQNVRANINQSNINSASDLERRIKFFTDEIELEGLGAVDSFCAAYKYSSKDNLMILSDMYRRSLTMITNMNIWGIIDNAEHSKLLDQITPPNY